MISFARTLLVPVLLFSLAGCGLKGPLYLPDEQPEAVPAPAGTPQPAAREGSKVRTPLPPAPQSQKKDRERASPQSAPAQSAPAQAAPAQSTPTQSTPAETAPPPVSPTGPDRPATPPPGQ